jgi:hypothetical protein
METLPDALLLLAPGCAHCPTVLEGLSGLLKTGRLGRLEVINIAAHPEAAAAAGTRSVPWCRIGPFELAGLHSPAELAGWVEHAAQGTGMPEYLSDLLGSQQLAKVQTLVTERPGLLADLVNLIADLDTPMGVRIGVGAVFEDLAVHGRLDEVVPQLAALTRASAPQVRADAAHYLGLSRHPDAAAALQALLQDDDAEVREIAAESLALLDSAAAD